MYPTFLSELTTRKKVKRVIWDYFGRITFIFLFLYLFVVSLDFLSAAFQLLGGKKPCFITWLLWYVSHIVNISWHELIIYNAQ